MYTMYTIIYQEVSYVLYALYILCLNNTPGPPKAIATTTRTHYSAKATQVRPRPAPKSNTLVSFVAEMCGGLRDKRKKT